MKHGLEGTGRLNSLVTEAIRSGLFPGCALAVSRRGKTLVGRAWGRLTFAPWSPEVSCSETFFDLASLTKPLATACSFITLVAAGTLDTETTLSDIFRHVPADKSGITVKQLLSHSSGLPAHRPFYRKWMSDGKHGYVPDRQEIIRAVLSEPLEFRPGTRALYSDLGYILAGCMVEVVTGTTFHDYVKNAVLVPLDAHGITVPGTEDSGLKYRSTAPTGMCPFEHCLTWCMVNDLNARSMGGFAGHAGLFGTARGVMSMLQKINEIRHGNLKIKNLPSEVLRLFLKRDKDVPGSTWAMGFDTPSPHQSSSGRFFSPLSVGHLGFTGTSFWIDLEKDITVVFLSNRTFPRASKQSQEAMRRFRPGLHDEVMKLIV